ncbi:hypothetical protein [Fictibacillus phosphorivorans]|uniref:hypothetical protein n=1 Tax=Fictibacillus phosphorivorans TaxID=1221500 RepID=UPI00203AB17E|nr:hypothetical protein [Fictibacillus phosphorivorans]MCM3716908.1 hypothetical protein [Fictibacillus phosphorivorans]MCM3774543.1 hypothetical protein [Fictibacillus phosphorivorans]
MRLLITYGILIIMFQLTGCFNDSVYKKDKDSPVFQPREYYRKHISFSEIGFFNATSLAEEMKDEITRDALVKHAIVIKQDKNYLVAIKMKAYHRKKAQVISEQYKKQWEEKWKIPVEITYDPNDYRKAEIMMRTKKRA